MQQSMVKSHSLPGLFGLGCNGPRSGCHLRKSTLSFCLDSAVDQQRRDAPSNEVIAMVTHMKVPGWRLNHTDPGKRNVSPNDSVQGMAKNCHQPRVAPAWLKHDKQVLRFYGFFQEHVSESNQENSRYRHCVINYFMEDGTLQITEPKVENSGMHQGNYLRRHKVPHATDYDFFGPNDFRCGTDVIIYSRCYHITGCDRFTRWFFEENGVDVGEDEPAVEDMWAKNYKFAKAAEKGLNPPSRSVTEAKILNQYNLGIPPPNRGEKQFMEYDRKVLRFNAYWDDTTLYGARTYFICHFYLSDNTFEMNEEHVRNSGKDNFPVFYRRSKLLKTNRTNCYPGMLEPDPEPYSPEDFRVGEHFWVWRRKIVIYNCDDFTRKFYMDYLGIDQAKGTLDVEEPPVRSVVLPPPPHTGPGTEEDSLRNCLMIQPKPPRKDLVRLMTLSGEILRFEAKIDNGLPMDEARRLLIGFYPADDNIAVWETRQRNSGFMPGRFCEKVHWKNPETGRYYELSDFAVGKTVLIKKHQLRILRADEHTLKYCEVNSEIFPYADPALCARRLAPVQDALEFRDPDGIDPDRLRELASEAGVALIDHEVITLLRAFPAPEFEGARGPRIAGERILEVLGV